MSTEHLFAFITFAIIASITPGPNNLMLMASGSVFGLRRTIPHILGVVFGFAVLLGAMILGLGLLLEQVPAVTKTVQLAGAVWLAWLGCKLAYSALSSADQPRAGQRSAKDRPLYAFEAALFQWANPKALVMTASCAAAFGALSASVSVRLAVMISVFSIIGIVTSVLWVLAGSTIARWLNTGWSARAAQIVMGLLFVGTGVYLAIL
ncbi:LysE family translocator [Erythrobacter sp. HA6-11]